MSSGAAGPWFPYYEEETTLFSSFQDLNVTVLNGILFIPSVTLRLRDLPADPPPLPAIPRVPGWTYPKYLHGHTILQLAASGSVYARWPSLNADAVAQTVFTMAELNLLNPDPLAENQNRPIFGVGITNQTATAGLPPLMISYNVSARPATSPLPTGLPLLTAGDLTMRQALIAVGPSIREDCWPEFGPPGAPPPPPTLNDRSFYRIKTLPALHDANGNQFPDELEGYFTNLLVSEVCYATPTPVSAHQPHTFPLLDPPNPNELTAPAFLGRPPDWVEILNPTNQPISTANYFLSDKSTNPARARLPAVTIPAYGTLVLLLSDSPHPLFAAEGDPASLLRQCWIPWRLKDEGEVVYLHQDTVPASTADPLALVDALGPPQIGTTALTGYTVGKVPRADHTWQTVFLPASSVDQVNQGWGLTRILAAPVITEVPLAGGPASPARSRLFRRAADMPRILLSHPDPTASLAYTLDGSEPSPNDGIYTGPLEIQNTTVLRVRAFASNAIPSPVVTRTYISSEGVLCQLEPPVMPLGFLGTTGRFDPAFAAAYGHTVPPPRAGYPSAKTILDQLEARPAVFLTFSPKGQTYPPGGGENSETAGAFEWTNPARPGDYRQENAFIQKTGGNASSQYLKKSFDVIFKGSTTLTGKSSWQGPVLDSGAQSGTSSLFPGSKVTSFPRLLLRNPSQASFLNGHGPTPKTYINDAWMKETQRALSADQPFSTVQRRWVHVFINGYYWGVYDMEEHFDSDTISAHLLAALPASATNAEKDMYKPSLIYAGQPGGPPQFATAAIKSEWWYNTAAAKARQVYDATPVTRPIKFAALEDTVDLNAYIDYITTLQVVDHDELGFDNVRAWRHPVTHKWYIMAWDGDVIQWGYFQAGYINASPATEVGESDQAVHNAAKLTPEYVARFASRLQFHLAGPLSFNAISSRFNAMAGDFRLTLECEALRWGRPPYEGDNLIQRWDGDISYLKPHILNPHPAVDAFSLYNNLIKSAKLPGYLPPGYPLLTP
jgi:CotH kinase protein/Fn3 associated